MFVRGWLMQTDLISLLH